jgi:hypothetical protein
MVFIARYGEYSTHESRCEVAGEFGVSFTLPSPLLCGRIESAEVTFRGLQLRGQCFSTISFRQNCDSGRS